MRAIDLSVVSSLEACEATIARGMRSFVEVGNALAAIRDQRLYRQRGFETFEAYCKERWQLGRHRAYQLIDGAETAESMLTMVNTPAPDNERQVRPLLKLSDAKERAEAWREAVRTAPAGRVTARHVAEAVRGWLPATQGKKQKPTGELADDEEQWPAQVILKRIADAIDDALSTWPSNESRGPVVSVLKERFTSWKMALQQEEDGEK